MSQSPPQGGPADAPSDALELARRAARSIEHVRRERDRLYAALTEAHRQLGRLGDKGPKQIGRAMMTMERALGIYEEPS